MMYSFYKCNNKFKYNYLPYIPYAIQEKKTMKMEWKGYKKQNEQFELNNFQFLHMLCTLNIVILFCFPETFNS